MRRPLFAVLTWSLAASSLNGQAVDRSLILDEFDIANDGDVLLIPVTVGGKNCRFKLDTGCSRTSFDTSLSQFLGPRLKTLIIQTANGLVERDHFSCPPIFVGRIPVSISTGVISKPFASSPDGVQLDGVLGMDVLHQFVVQLDFEHGKLKLLKSAGFQPGTPVPLLSHPLPMIEATYPRFATNAAYDRHGCHRTDKW